MTRMRIDAALVRLGLAPSRERSKELIKNGQVYLGEKAVTKPSDQVDEEDLSKISVRGETLPYVSRGGLKLKRAVDVFGLNLTGLTCMDVGASTGGFTDCMLQEGAAKVYAVDVGTSQLCDKLRNDPRVRSMEQTNARYIRTEDIGEPVDFIGVDVSFISLTLLLDPLRDLLKKGGQMVCLIKPQFEVGKGKIGKKGIVKDPKARKWAVDTVKQAAVNAGFITGPIIESPVKGGSGNTEYLMYCRLPEDKGKEDEELSDHYQ